MVEEKVAKLSMDNSDFEKKAKQSSKTLQTLEKDMQFTGGEKSFDNIYAGAVKSQRGFQDMAASVANVEKRFSSLGIIGDQVIRNMTTKAQAFVSRTAKTLFTGSKRDGAYEYAEKMGAIQTIKAGSGESLDVVKDKLEELNRYADLTKYSFRDMTMNIGKFTNAGVSLDKSVAAIQGISNLAAISGANAEQASHSMYNFAQALSSGYVKLIDWKSIEIANMATVDFKNQLIETAVALGTIQKQGEDYVSVTTNMNGSVSDAFNATKNFNDSLQSQWLTTDVLVTTLEKYTDTSTELGKSAMKAATTVRTWSAYWDNLKESLGSGWAQSFEYIFGDYDEIADRFKELMSVTTDVFAGFAKRRNEVLRLWHGGDVDTSAMERAADNIATRLGVAKEEVRDLVKQSSNAAEATEKITDKYFQVLSSGSKGKQVSLLQKMLGVKQDGTFGPETEAALRKFQEFNGLKVTGTTDVDTWKELVPVVGKISTALSTAFEPMSSGYNDTVSGIKNIVGYFKSWSSILKEQKSKFFGDITAEDTANKLKKASAWFKDITSNLVSAEKIASRTKVVQAVFSVGAKAKNVLTGAASQAFALLKSLDIKEFKNTIFESIGNSIRMLKTGFDELGNSRIGIFFKNASAAVSEFFANFKKLPSLVNLGSRSLSGIAGATIEFFGALGQKGLSALSNASNKVGEFVGKIKNAFTKRDTFGGEEDSEEDDTPFIERVKKRLGITEESLESFKNSAKEFGSKIASIGASVFSVVKEALSNLSLKKILGLIVGAAAIPATFNLLGVTKSLKETGKHISSIFGTLDSSFKKKAMDKTPEYANSMRTFVLSLILISASIGLLASIPKGDLIRSVIVLGSIIGAITAITVAMALLAKKSMKTKDPKALTAHMNAMTKNISAIANTAIKMAFAIKTMQGISLWDMTKSIGAISAMLFGVTKIFSMLSKVDVTKGSKLGGFKLAGLSLSLIGLVGTLALLSHFNWNLKNIFKLSIGVGAMFGISKLLGQFGKQTASFKNVLAVTLSLYIFVQTLNNINKLSGKLKISSFLVLAACIGALYLATGVLSKTVSSIKGIKGNKQIIAFAASMVLISVAARMMASAAKAIGRMSFGNLLKGLLGMVGITAVIGALLVAVGYAANLAGGAKIKQFGSTILILSISFWNIFALTAVMSLISYSALSRGLSIMLGITAVMAGAVVAMGYAGKLSGFRSIGPAISAMLMLLTVSGILILFAAMSGNGSKFQQVMKAGILLVAAVGTISLALFALSKLPVTGGALIGILKIVGIIAAVGAAMLLGVFAFKVFGKSLADLGKSAKHIKALAEALEVLGWKLAPIAGQMVLLGLASLVMGPGMAVLGLGLGVLAIPALAVAKAIQILTNAVLALASAFGIASDRSDKFGGSVKKHERYEPVTGPGRPSGGSTPHYAPIKKRPPEIIQNESVEVPVTVSTEDSDTFNAIAEAASTASEETTSMAESTEEASTAADYIVEKFGKIKEYASETGVSLSEIFDDLDTDQPGIKELINGVTTGETEEPPVLTPEQEAAVKQKEAELQALQEEQEKLAKKNGARNKEAYNQLEQYAKDADLSRRQYMANNGIKWWEGMSQEESDEYNAIVNKGKAAKKLLESIGGNLSAADSNAAAAASSTYGLDPTAMEHMNQLQEERLKVLAQNGTQLLDFFETNFANGDTDYRESELVTQINDLITSGVYGDGSVINTIAESLSGGDGEIEEKGQELGSKFASLFAGGLSDELGNVLSPENMPSLQAFTALSTALDDFNPEEFNAIGLNMATEIGTGLSTGVSAIDVSNQTTAVANRVKAPFERLPNGMVDIGYQTVNGLTVGLQNGSSGAIMAAQSLGNDVINALKSSLGVHSPSWKAQYAASMVIAGFVNEMDSHGSDMADKTKENALNAIRAFDNPINNYRRLPGLSASLTDLSTSGLLSTMNSQYSPNVSKEILVNVIAIRENLETILDLLSSRFTPTGNNVNFSSLNVRGL